jgi:signal transduction histidine kinase
MLHTNLEQATRALSLLLDNAMKFTHPAEAAGGAAAVTEKASVVLHVAISSSLSSAATPCEEHDERQLCFIVEDTGIGIPPEEAEHIFEEFVQLDEYYDGTGIGLTVARSIARRLGGDIMLDTSYNSPNGGARFVFSLPM